jgi:hypothetical protein
MNTQPQWVWKQRTAVARFLLSFYVRRGLDKLRRALPAGVRGAKPPTHSKSLPRRYPRRQSSSGKVNRFE